MDVNRRRLPISLFPDVHSWDFDCLPVPPFGVMVSDIMMNELSTVVGELGGQAAIGRAVHSDEDMSAAILAGFSHAAVEGLLESSGLSLQEITSSLDLSLRSSQRRKSQGRLARYESDRLYRLARLVRLPNFSSVTIRLRSTG
jgi:hypothetical protein